jgi:glutamine amidotransferase
MIAIVDYGAGNIKSVEKALQFLGAEVVVTADGDEILGADGVILPGVGAFGDAMGRLRAGGLDRILCEAVKKGMPFLGICLGLQLLFESSEESPGVEGLGILQGKVVKIPETAGLKIPHMGWNSLEFGTPAGRLFEGLPKLPYVYFVHSYYLQAKEQEIVTATTEYGVKIHASIEKGNVFACQFHPEKSGEVGLRMLQNFLRIAEVPC